jgi:hypothetical protein
MTPPVQIDWNLKGKRIAVPEMRELEVFSALLERRGAEVLRCPLVTIYDSPHSAQVLAFAVKLADGGFDDFVLITGEGLTRIMSCIDKYEPALRPRSGSSPASKPLNRRPTASSARCPLSRSKGAASPCSCTATIRTSR